MVSWEASLVAPEPLQQQESLDNPKVHLGLLGNRQARQVGRWSTGSSPTNWRCFFLLLYLIQGGQSEEEENSHIPTCPTFRGNTYFWFTRSDFAALFKTYLPTFSCATRSTEYRNLTFYFSLNSLTGSPLFFSLTHRGTKSRGSITAGGLGDILIPYYWVQD